MDNLGMSETSIWVWGEISVGKKILIKPILGYAKKGGKTSEYSQQIPRSEKTWT